MTQAGTNRSPPPRRAPWVLDRPKLIVIAVLALAAAIGIGLSAWTLWSNDLRWRVAPPLVSDFHYARRGPTGARVNFTENYSGLGAAQIQEKIEAQGFSCSANSTTIDCQRFQSNDASCLEEWRVIAFLDRDNKVVGGRGEIDNPCM